MTKARRLSAILLCAVSLRGVHAAMPNIVLILADDMGYGDAGCYNPESKIPTPHLDRLAAEGMRFTDAHAGGNYCVPSRYALMTGRFAARKKMALKAPLIEEGRMTVASMLRDHGYVTALVGKWHLGFDRNPQGDKGKLDFSKPFLGGPADRGFDSFFGMHASLDIPPYFYIRDRIPTQAPTGDVKANKSTGTPDGWNGIQGAFWRAGKVAPDFKFEEVTPRFVQETVGIIRAHGKGRKEKPLFLYLALPSPHTPWLPLEAFRGRSGAGMYGDFVMQVDAGIGQVMAALSETGMKENTLVMFSSDNGPVWYENNTKRFGHSAVGVLRGMKFASWEGGHRMPFIVRWPGRVAQGSVCEQTIVFSDVFATFAEVVGMKQIPEGMAEDSVSFLPYLVDADKFPAKRPPIVHDPRTIRDGDWKLILGKKNAKSEPPPELYNLKTDICEQHNLTSQYPELTQKLKAMLSAELGK